MTQHQATLDQASIEQRMQLILQADRAVAEERWASWKALDAAAWKLAESRLQSSARLQESATHALERRLAELDQAFERLEKMIHDRVRSDVYAKDMERLYAERQQQNATAAQARIQAESSAVANRRTIVGTMVTSGVALVSVAVSIVLHFLDGLRLR